jgi:hypothetical protein
MKEKGIEINLILQSRFTSVVCGAASCKNKTICFWGNVSGMKLTTKTVNIFAHCICLNKFHRNKLTVLRNNKD